MAPIGKLFAPKKPTSQPVVRMPDKQDPQAIEARKRKQAELTQGKGRVSTDLSGTYASDSLGV